MHTIQDIKDCLQGGSMYMYYAIEGAIASSKDPVLGEIANISVLRDEVDFLPHREHPSIGDRIECYRVEGEKVVFFASDWVVYHVEVFPGTGIVKEVVIAWCRKEPLSFPPRTRVIPRMQAQ